MEDDRDGGEVSSGKEKELKTGTNKTNSDESAKERVRANELSNATQPTMLTITSSERKLNCDKYRRQVFLN